MKDNLCKDKLKSVMVPAKVYGKGQWCDELKPVPVKDVKWHNRDIMIIIDASNIERIIDETKDNLSSVKRNGSANGAGKA